MWLHTVAFIHILKIIVINQPLSDHILDTLSISVCHSRHHWMVLFPSGFSGNGKAISLA